MNLIFDVEYEMNVLRCSRVSAALVTEIQSVAQRIAFALRSSSFETHTRPGFPPLPQPGSHYAVAFCLSLFTVIPHFWDNSFEVSLGK